MSTHDLAVQITNDVTESAVNHLLHSPIPPLVDTVQYLSDRVIDDAVHGLNGDQAKQISSEEIRELLSHLTPGTKKMLGLYHHSTNHTDESNSNVADIVPEDADNDESVVDKVNQVEMERAAQILHQTPESTNDTPEVAGNELESNTPEVNVIETVETIIKPNGDVEVIDAIQTADGDIQVVDTITKANGDTEVIETISHLNGETQVTDTITQTKENGAVEIIEAVVSSDGRVEISDISVTPVENTDLVEVKEIKAVTSPSGEVHVTETSTTIAQEDLAKATEEIVSIAKDSGETPANAGENTAADSTSAAQPTTADNRKSLVCYILKETSI